MLEREHELAIEHSDCPTVARVAAEVVVRAAVVAVDFAVPNFDSDPSDCSVDRLAIDLFDCAPAGCFAAVVVAAVAFDCAVVGLPVVVAPAVGPVAGPVERRGPVAARAPPALSRDSDCCCSVATANEREPNSSNRAPASFDCYWTDFGPCFAAGPSADSRNRCSS